MASLQSDAVQGHLRTLFNEGAVGALADAELLDRFLTRRGEAAESAFATLVERHAPMVLATCRHVLGDVHDAQDASQAAFLVLARKARSIRRGQAIGGWLHSVAVRIASKARAAAARRRAHERRGAEMAVSRADEPARADRWADIHDQIDRLPDRFRLPIVLCYLEGLTHAQAAEQLGWPVGTVESRLARARDRLRRRMVGRDSWATNLPASLPALPVIDATPASRAWVKATARAATQFAAGTPAAAVATAHVASMTRGALAIMTLHQVRVAVVWLLAAMTIATCATVAFQPGPEEDRPALPQAPPRPVTLSEGPKAPPAIVPVTIKIGGRVLDPAGEPVPRAKLWLAFQGTDWTWSTRVPQLRTAAGPDGRFDLTVLDNDPEVSRALRMTSGMPGGFGDIQIVATADGLGPAWTGLAEAKGDVALRLTTDDIPIEGRLVSLEGHPLAGVEVRTLRVEDPARADPIFGAPSGYVGATSTDADGRFRLMGIGRGRRVLLGIAGPGIQRDAAQVVTGSFPKDRPPHYTGYPVYGARFEHPCKPGKSISGVVRDLDTGAPLAGIAVRSYVGTYVQATTDQQGRYRLDGNPRLTSFRLHASARGGDQPYITSELTVPDSSDYAPVGADIAMVRGVVVTGRLIDRSNGRPVQAWVAYAALEDNPHWKRLPGFQSGGNGNGPRPGWHVPSMADGSFRLVVPPGRGFLVAHIQYQSDKFIPAGVPPKERPGAPADALSLHYGTVPFELFPQHFPAVRPIEIAPGTESVTCDLTLDSGVVRTGTVLDPAGRPVSGASMIGETYRDTSQFLPLDGSHFTVYGLSASPLLIRTLVFRHEGLGLGKAVQVDGNDRGPIAVRLEPTAAVTGRLLDEVGKPVEGIVLRMFRLIEEPTRGAQREFSPSIQAASDQDGRFRIVGIIPGVTQKLSARGFQGEAEGFILMDWTPKPGEVRDLGEVRLSGGD